MSDAGVVLSAIASSAVVAGAVSALVSSVAEARVSKLSTRWEMKRQTCLSALAVVDAVFAHAQWTMDGKTVPIQAQPRPTIEVIRRVQNELALTCEDPEVSKNYLRCLGVDDPPTADALVDLRAAIRRELGFGEPVDSDRQKAFIARIEQAQPPSATA